MVKKKNVIFPNFSSDIVEVECDLIEYKFRPNKSDFLREFEDLNYRFVDSEENLEWINDQQTVVIMIDTRDSNSNNYVAWLASAVVSLKVKEFSYVWHRDGLLVRMYWK